MNPMKLSTKILYVGLGIFLIVTLFIIVIVLPLGWTGMLEFIPSNIMRVIIFSALGAGLLLIVIGIASKVFALFKK
jgi:hypothetical protein